MTGFKAKCAGQRKPVYSMSLLCPALCGQSCAPHPPKPLSPPAKATVGSVYQQPYRGMDLDGTQQEDLPIAKPMISGCQTIYMSFAIYYIISIIFLMNTPQISCLLRIDCYNLFKLINPK